MPAAAPAPPSEPLSHDEPGVTHGVVVGDVTARTAVLWARADREGTLKVHLSGGKHHGVARLDVHAADDYTGQVVLTGLRPDTTYRYRVGSERGSFETAPAADDPEAVRLAFGGDVAGQNVCRDTREGFPIFETIRARRPDVFVGLGDMIYADNACNALGLYGNAQVPGPGPAADLATFWAHWRYNRADAASQRLLRSTSYVGVWDDHEVVNDFGPLNDTRATPPYTPGVHLLPIGLDAFLDYTPIAVAPNTPKRLYRSLRWGKHVELFVLDTRQYRDANIADDSADRPKTMLGREQLTWLKESLAASDATWKVIVSSVPMSIPTGFPVSGGRDGWANFTGAVGLRAGAAGHPRASWSGERIRQHALDHHGRPLRGGVPLPAVPAESRVRRPRAGERAAERGNLPDRCVRHDAESDRALRPPAAGDRRDLGAGEGRLQLRHRRGRPPRPVDGGLRQHRRPDLVLPDAIAAVGTKTGGRPLAAALPSAVVHPAASSSVGW